MINQQQSRGVGIEARAPRIEPMCILLADDDLDFLGLLAGSLRGDGYVVIEVSSGIELLRRSTAEELEASGVDVIISDVIMPGVSGMGMLMQVNQMVSPPPVVMITGISDTDIHAWADQLGAVAMFDKPFELDDLRTLLLNLRSARRPSRRRSPSS